jgi:MFS family permease
VFTNTADSALYLMVAVWVKELTGSDAAAALVLATMSLPALIAPFVGQIADRFPRRRLLVVANVSIAAVITSLSLVDSASWLWLIYGVIFAYGTVGYLTSAAQSGLLRDLLPDEYLASGNGALSTIDQILRLISPLIGTGLYVFIGPIAVVWLTAACFIGAAVLVAGVRVTESHPETKEARGSYWYELSAGFRHLARTPVLGRLTLLIAVGFGATGLYNVAIFPVMEQGLGVPPSTLGLLVSFQGVGAVLGGASSAWSISRFGEVRTFSWGMAVLGLGITPLLGSSLAAALIGLTAIGFGVTWTIVSFVTLRQRLTPPRLQGRTGAATNMAINLPQTALNLLGVAALALLDYRVLLLATALAVLICAGLASIRSKRPDPINQASPAVH